MLLEECYFPHAAPTPFHIKHGVRQNVAHHKMIELSKRNSEAARVI
jgi:hypothetical protein